MLLEAKAINIESEIELSYSTGFEIDRALKSDLIFNIVSL